MKKTAAAVVIGCAALATAPRPAEAMGFLAILPMIGQFASIIDWASSKADKMQSSQDYTTNTPNYVMVMSPYGLANCDSANWKKVGTNYGHPCTTVDNQSTVLDGPAQTAQPQVQTAAYYPQQEAVSQTMVVNSAYGLANCNTSARQQNGYLCTTVSGQQIYLSP